MPVHHDFELTPRQFHNHKAFPVPGKDAGHWWGRGTNFKGVGARGILGIDELTFGLPL